MAFKSLLSLLSVVAVTYAMPRDRHTSTDVTCPDGTKVEDVACCPLISFRDDLQKNFFHNECGAVFRSILRVYFHDAIGHSRQLQEQGQPAGGGADGSILTFSDVETNFPENRGISKGVNNLLPLVPSSPISPADLIYFATAVGLTNCPGAPRLEFKLGRPNATAPAPEGMIPGPQESADKIFARMKDGGDFSPDEVVALLASHSVARSDNMDPTIKGIALDTTPSKMDTQFFLEVLLKGVAFPGTPNNTGEALSPLPLHSANHPPEGRFQSDFAIARDDRSACSWQGFINQQDKMTSAFKRAMAKLALIGQDEHKLITCSSVIPEPVPASGKPATYPATKTFADIQQVCPIPFPHLATDPGATETLIPPCPC